MGAQTQQLQQLTPLAGQRQQGETADAVKACNDYLRMQPRSLRRLAAVYADTTGGNAAGRQRQLEQWSALYAWVARAEAYDVERERYKTARANAILDAGIARTENRVLQLDRVNRLLMEQLDQGALWLEDFKSVGSGDRQQVLQILKYNSALIRDVLKTLEDAAAETGGRAHKVDMTVTGLAGALASVPNFGAVGDAEDAVYTDVTDETDDTTTQ